MIDCKKEKKEGMSDHASLVRPRRKRERERDLLGGVTAPLDDVDGILGCSDGPAAPWGLGPGRLGHTGLQAGVEYGVFICGEVKDVRPKFGGKSLCHLSLQRGRGGLKLQRFCASVLSRGLTTALTTPTLVFRLDRTRWRMYEAGGIA